jgi:hypothetical protein
VAWSLRSLRLLFLSSSVERLQAPFSTLAMILLFLVLLLPFPLNNKKVSGLSADVVHRPRILSFDNAKRWHVPCELEPESLPENSKLLGPEQDWL